MKLLWHLWQFMQSRFLMLINHDMIRIWSQKWQPVDKCFDKIVCMPKRNSDFNLKSTLSWCDHLDLLPAYFGLLTIEIERREKFSRKDNSIQRHLCKMKSFQKFLDRCCLPEAKFVLLWLLVVHLNHLELLYLQLCSFAIGWMIWNENTIKPNFHSSVCLPDLSPW